MKRLLAGIVLCTTVYGTMIAGDTATQRTFTSARVERIERDLINAFQSEIPGLQVSAATTLIQVRREFPSYAWSNSIIPLMHIVNGEDHNEDARVAAALALYELRSGRGDNSIARNAQFGDNARVKHFCAMLVATRQLEKGTE